MDSPGRQLTATLAGRSRPRWARIAGPITAGLLAVSPIGGLSGCSETPSQPAKLIGDASSTSATPATLAETTSTIPATTAPPTTVATTAPPTTAAPTTTTALEAFYANCDEARRNGAAPLHRGDPGYRDALDRDDDSVACEK